MYEDLFTSCLHLDPNQEIIAQLQTLPAERGILLYADAKDTPVQIQVVANIRRTSLARLCETPDENIAPGKPLAGVTAKIYYTPCYNDFTAHRHCRKAVTRLFPEDPDQYARYPSSWMVSLNRTQRWPTFQLTPASHRGPVEDAYGLFPSRKAAAHLIEILEDVFRLCRTQCSNTQQANPTSCPYMQMDACLAPCLGRCTPQEYEEALHQACLVTSGKGKAVLEQFQNQMKACSENMEFEAALSIKRRLDKLKKLLYSDYHWTHRLNDLAILHIDRGPKKAQEGKKRLKRSYCAFLIRWGHIVEFPPFCRDELAQLYESLQSLLVDGTSNDPPDQSWMDDLAVCQYCLFRSKPPGIWIDCSDAAIPSALEIEQKMAERFNLSASKNSSKTK